MKRPVLAAAVCAISMPLFAFACGGGQPEATTPANPPASASASAPAAEAPAASSAAPAASAAPSAAPSATEAAAPSGPPKEGEWDTWSHDQKAAYMKAFVLPKMGGLFHDFDAKTFAEPKCTLCHGSGAKDGTFKMPNPELPKLDLTPAGMGGLKAKKPKIFDFMMKEVEPEMAKQLGEPVFDMKTKKGFGCLGCHTMKEKK
jgi:hypothetical protein